DRQCIVYACEALQRNDVDVELVAMKIRLLNGELQSDNPLNLYRLRTEPTLRLVKCWAAQNSSELWIALNRLFVHAYAALQHSRHTSAGRITFYTKNYSSACLLLLVRRLLMS